MTKTQFVSKACEIYRKTGNGKNLSESDMEAAFNAISQAMLEAMANGETVTLSFHVGSFRVTERAERKGRNPRTGEEITIPARKIVKFSEGKALKEALK